MDHDDQPAETIAEDGRILAALDEARAGLAWTLRAIDDGLPPEVVDQLTDTMYTTLRARLSHQELLRAVFTCVVGDAEKMAAELVAPVDDDDLREAIDVWTEQGYGTSR